LKLDYVYEVLPSLLDLLGLGLSVRWAPLMALLVAGRVPSGRRENR